MTDEAEAVSRWAGRRDTRVRPAHLAAQPEVHGRKGPILLIDSDAHNLRALSYLLTHEGYAVETASNGLEGLARLRQLRPPLVFLDVRLPRMNGYEVCAQVKQDPALATTYVIMLSAKGQQVDRERGLLSGADEYLTKPFSPREIARRVQAVLADSATAEMAGAQTVGTASAETVGTASAETVGTVGAEGS